jgi:hypothetical protein
VQIWQMPHAWPLVLPRQFGPQRNTTPPQSSVYGIVCVSAICQLKIVLAPMNA